MTKTEAYYQENQRSTERFRKYPNGKAMKDGFSKSQNHRMYMSALAHQSMVSDLEYSQASNGNEIRRYGHIRTFM